MDTEKTNKSIVGRAVETLYGGINLTWPKVILLAVVAAVITFVFLFFPIFKNTSFERMGVTFEAWIFFAVIIMSNCKKPLESAVKTFVFFLVSQPLIYLLQVPFSQMGWGLFSYYKYWFIWTLLTFPLAYIGWYIQRKDWLSLLILSPLLIYLAVTTVNSFQFTASHFPLMLVTALFCLLQIVLYVYAFTSNIWQKLVGIIVPFAIALALMLLLPQVDVNGTNFLPNDPVLTDDAVVVMDDSNTIKVSIESTGKDSLVRVQADAYGSADFTIQDGEKEYQYTVNVYEDNTGSPQVDIVER